MPVALDGHVVPNPVPRQARTDPFVLTSLSGATPVALDGRGLRRPYQPCGQIPVPSAASRIISGVIELL
jgi:hypothetical protein